MSKSKDEILKDLMQLGVLGKPKVVAPPPTKKVMAPPPVIVAPIEEEAPVEEENYEEEAPSQEALILDGLIGRLDHMEEALQSMMEWCVEVRGMLVPNGADQEEQAEDDSQDEFEEEDPAPEDEDLEEGVEDEDLEGALAEAEIPDEEPEEEPEEATNMVASPKVEPTPKTPAPAEPAEELSLADSVVAAFNEKVEGVAYHDPDAEMGVVVEAPEVKEARAASLKNLSKQDALEYIRSKVLFQDSLSNNLPPREVPKPKG